MNGPAPSLRARITEVIVAILLIPALVAATPCVWAFGRIHGHSSLFFRQDRVGLDGRRIRVVKFRTMDEGQEEVDCGPVFRLLRRSGIDELPQILAVLRGRMALIGPRPLLMRDLFPEGISVDRRLWEAIRERQSIRPGITGISQVLDRRRARTGWTYWRMLDADLWYVRHRSLALDTLLLAITPLYALTGGAVRFPSRRLTGPRERFFSGFGAPGIGHP